EPISAAGANGRHAEVGSRAGALTCGGGTAAVGLRAIVGVTGAGGPDRVSGVGEEEVGLGLGDGGGDEVSRSGHRRSFGDADVDEPVVGGPPAQPWRVAVGQ